MVSKMVETEVSIKCDNPECGKEVESDSVEGQEFISIGHVCGYGSAFGDNKRVELDLCDSCFKNLLGHLARVYE